MYYITAFTSDWSLPFVYNLFLPELKALASLRICADSLEPSLIADRIVQYSMCWTIFPWANSDFEKIKRSSDLVLLRRWIYGFVDIMFESIWRLNRQWFGLKTPQKSGSRLKLSPYILGEPGIELGTLGEWFTCIHYTTSMIWIALFINFNILCKGLQV